MRRCGTCGLISKLFKDELRPYSDRESKELVRDEMEKVMEE